MCLFPDCCDRPLVCFRRVWESLCVSQTEYLLALLTGFPQVCVCVRERTAGMISALVPQCIPENYQLTWMHVCEIKDTNADRLEHLHQRGCGNVTA